MMNYLPYVVLVVFACVGLGLYSGCTTAGNNIHSITRACPQDRNISGCNEKDDWYVPLPEHSARFEKKVDQIPLDNPYHLFSAVVEIQDYCPMNFLDAYLTKADHAKQAIAAREALAKENKINGSQPNDPLRKMRLTCWAIAEYVVKSHKFYEPLHLLSNHLTSYRVEDDGSVSYVLDNNQRGTIKAQ